MTGQVQRVLSAVIDGRAQTPRYIQKQLAQLYDALQKAKPAIHNAIRHDTEYSSAEADSEIFLAMKVVKQQYEAFNWEEFLDQEYSLAHSKDNLSRRVPIGCVYIIPSQHNRFYSIILPACAAIAAGNCVMVEISQTLLQLGALLRKIFAASMDRDTFAVVESKPADADLFKHCIVVDGRAESTSPASFQVLSSPASRTIAIVDRTSIVKKAAQDIVRARFAFCGRSPYAPDLVLVNEFVFEEFCNAAARHATERFGSKVSVHSIRSLDDAIDLVNSRSTTPLRAAYLFAVPPAAKYLSQFIYARISFTDHIPADLLIGPPAPVTSPTSVHPRYTKEMFSTLSPQYITQSSQHSILSQLLDQDNRAAQAKINAEISAPLPPMNEPLGKAIGFFEQGLLTGGVVAIVSAVTGLAFMTKYAGPSVIQGVRYMIAS
ncbi:Uncharacterized protein BP5553_09849 [Venustampulla echinocandica]|uniref:Aldehyde dehydrogenase domain-containing protein n=1 Tax=Venustampulla echinocandica TaxID=2656787 RepID=A0A370TAU8_9HELO|nr:Uncharacterized protein BP5553_09849 [Venustampulla echinocandica]RDL31060.1 Uncharacterized protein BP5553_09849 [Venustampulla echinocandica]